MITIGESSAQPQKGFAEALEQYACYRRKLGDAQGGDLYEARVNKILKKNIESLTQAVTPEVIKSKAINLAKPSYPEEARQLRAQGESGGANRHW